MTNVTLRQLASDEKIIFTKTYPAKYTSYDHVIAGPDLLIFASSFPNYPTPFEYLLEVPLEASVWIVDTICALILPQAMDGVPDDVFAVNLESENAPLRLRRSAQVGGPGEQGFTLFHRGMPGPGGFASKAFADRTLFDEGLFPVLARVANEWAFSHGLPGPRQESATIRPNWMGRSSADTPPPSEE